MIDCQQGLRCRRPLQLLRPRRLGPFLVRRSSMAEVYKVLLCKPRGRFTFGSIVSLALRRHHPSLFTLRPYPVSPAVMIVVGIPAARVRPAVCEAPLLLFRMKATQWLAPRATIPAFRRNPAERP